MTLRFAYTVGFWAAIEFSLLSVLLGGEFNPSYWLALAIPLVAIPMRYKKKAVPGFIGIIGAMGTLAFTILTLLEKGIEAALFAGGIFLIGILLVRLLTGKTLKDDLQALLLSLLLVFSGSVLHTEVSFGFVLVGYSLAAVWALVTRQLVVGARWESERIGGASLEVSLNRRDIVTPTFFGVVLIVALVLIFSTSLLFLIFPRVGFHGFGFLSSRQGELPTAVSLFGGPVKIQGGESVIARLQGVSEDEFLKGLYLRGPIYSKMTSAGFEKYRHAWMKVEQRWSEFALPSPTAIHEYEISLQPVLRDGMPVLGRVYGARMVSGGTGNPASAVRIGGVTPEGTLFPTKPIRVPIRYKVRGDVVRPLGNSVGAQVPVQSMERAERELFKAYLQLPDDLNPKVLTLAQSFSTASNSIPETVGRMRQFLKSEFEYTLERPNGVKEDPLASFLLEDHRGHCEYFAAAFAVMLRAVGIPSRVVGGYQGGYWDDNWGGVVFRGKNAHVWLEWYHPGFGWRVDDATPVADATPLYLTGFSQLYERLGRWWDDRVLSFGLIDQVTFVSEAAIKIRHTDWKWEEFLPSVQWLWGVVLLGGSWVLWRRRTIFGGRIPSQHQRLGLEIKNRVEEILGASLPVSKSVGQTLSGVESCLTTADYAAVERIVRRYEESRFGSQELSGNEIRSMRKRIRSISRA